MLFDKVSEIKKYKGISNNLDKAIDTIVEGSFANNEIGKYEIDGKEVFFMIQEYTTKNLEDCTFETHVTYADIQMVLEGEEGIGYADVKNLEVTLPFNPDKDVEKQKGKSDIVLPMKDDNFVFFFPGEAHMPTMALGENKKVRKAVFKIKCN